MRKLLILFLACSAMLFTSCLDDEKEFDAADLVGHWIYNTDNYRYDSNGSGACWDTADDVTEEEAQPFTWTLEGDRLTLIHQIGMGGVVPKTYYLQELNKTTLSYKDSYDHTYTYTRVK